MIALLRMSGIPARYVVGMMMGEGFSHAWVEALIDGEWIGFDPTNDKNVDDTYIKISNGRDYQDCIVNRGVFYGCVTQNQNIKVIVSEV
jgi:transglutaminase-like putative cysteine protease